MRKFCDPLVKKYQGWRLEDQLKVGKEVYFANPANEEEFVSFADDDREESVGPSGKSKERKAAIIALSDIGTSPEGTFKHGTAVKFKFHRLLHLNRQKSDKSTHETFRNRLARVAVNFYIEP